MRLIGINGRLHSGKDTAFKYVNEWALDHELVAQRAGFADKLKLSGVRALGFCPDTVADAIEFADYIKEHGRIRVQLGGKVIGTWDISGRTFWQLYGTEAHRDVFDQEFWVDALLPKPGDIDQEFWVDALLPKPGDIPVFSAARLQKRFEGTDIVVITDVRFPNEARRILDLGGEIWELNANERLGAPPADVHPSESPLPAGLVSFHIDANGTPDELGARIVRLLDDE